MGPIEAGPVHEHSRKQLAMANQQRSSRIEATAVGPGAQTPIDIGRLTDFLPAMAPKWFEIGLKLGSTDTAISLGESPQPASRKCFNVIHEWMMSEGENASWEYLCGVILRSEGVGLGDVADRIERVIEMHSESDWVALVVGDNFKVAHDACFLDTYCRSSI